MNNYEQVTQEVRDAFQALCKGRVEAAVKAEREAIIDLVALYGGPVDLEAAIRARSNT